MATKTITIEMDAYEKLVEARREPRESFSSVVRRAVWPDEPATAGAILRDLQLWAKRRPEALLDDAALDALEGRQRSVRETSAWDESGA